MRRTRGGRFTTSTKASSTSTRPKRRLGDIDTSWRVVGPMPGVPLMPSLVMEVMWNATFGMGKTRVL